MSNFIIWAIAILVPLAISVAVFAWFFERATREVSLVRTGIGGRKVVMDGGLLALPYVHEVSRVNMQTLRLEVQRVGEAALITKDRLRVDVGVEFYVSVISSEEGIAKALQTIGTRTFHAEQLRELIEGKLVDALRSVAAKLSMDELHEQRSAFVTEVRDSLSESLARNGLELDSVSLTELDQTPFTALDENNAFNAVGMRKLAEVIAKSKKERAEIDLSSEVSVRKAAMEATKQKLQIELQEQEAQISQIQEIETLKAAQLAEVARRKADSERAAAHARIQMEQDIQTADIDRERFIREAEMAKNKQLQEAEIWLQKETELSKQDSQIAIAAKTQEQSKAQAAVATIKLDEIKAKEAVSTAQQLAEAERRKNLALIAAKQKVETDKLASDEQTRSRREEARVHKEELLAQAEGQRALVEVENTLSEQIISMKTDLARLETMPKVVKQMVKPAEKIDLIKIHQLSGLGGSINNGQSYSSDKPVVNQALDSIMDMAVQLPTLKKLGEEIGLNFGDGLTGMTNGSGKK